jgi:hypothetical protein
MYMGAEASEIFQTRSFKFKLRFLFKMDHISMEINKINTQIEKIDLELEEVAPKIQTVEQLSETPFADWSPLEIETYGTKEYLRYKETQVRNNKAQLDKEKDQLRVEKFKLNDERRQLTELQLLQEKRLANFNPESLIGTFAMVEISLKSIMDKYLTPIGSAQSSSAGTPTGTSTPPVIDLEALALNLEKHMFTKKPKNRPCLILDVDTVPIPTALTSEFKCKIVLVSGFDDKSITTVLNPTDYVKVMPIYPTRMDPLLKDLTCQIKSTPEWIPAKGRKTPSYILCLPINVTTHQLRRLKEECCLDDHNLQKVRLQTYLSRNFSAQADFFDSEEEEDDDGKIAQIREELFQMEKITA